MGPPADRSRTRSTIQAGAQVHATVVVVAVLAVLAVTTHDIWPMLLACALGGALATCWFSVLTAPAPTVQIDLGGALTAGIEATARVEVAQPGRGRSRPLLITHSICTSLVGPGRWYVEPLGPGESLSLRPSRIPLRRGYVTHTHLQIDSLGPFGFFRRRVTERINAPLDVFAPPVPPSELPQLDLGAHDGRGAPVGGDQVRGIREWRTGDSPRDVHWRSTARTGSLVVTERAEPARGTLVILAVGTYGELAFEAAVAEAAALAAVQLRRGSNVSLVWKAAAGEAIRVDVLEPHRVSTVFARLPTAQRLDPADLVALTALVPAGASLWLAAGPDDETTRGQVRRTLSGRAAVLP